MTGFLMVAALPGIGGWAIVGPDSSSDPDELEDDADDVGRTLAGGWRLKGGGAELPTLPPLPIRADGGRGERGSAGGCHNFC